eukprot:7195001-Pyramimonas_sp.AAC.1
MSFWKRRCVEQSRPESATVWPCSSPTICTSRWRMLLISFIKNTGDPGTSARTWGGDPRRHPSEPVVSREHESP